MEYLYVASGRDSIFKVGRTRMPEPRSMALRLDFQKLGDEMVSFHYWGPFLDACAGERNLVAEVASRLEAVPGRREWFRRRKAERAEG